VGNVGLITTLPAPDETKANSGVGMLRASNGYVAEKSAHAQRSSMRAAVSACSNYPGGVGRRTLKCLCSAASDSASAGPLYYAMAALASAAARPVFAQESRREPVREPLDYRDHRAVAGLARIRARRLAAYRVRRLRQWLPRGVAGALEHLDQADEVGARRGLLQARRLPRT
jgi:hypothetical protein